jgi:hypothetical protein
MARGKLEDLTNNKDGWALLSITLNDEERERARTSGPDAIYGLAVKRIQSDDFLHCNEQGFLWAKGEFFFKVRPSAKRQGGDLALKISFRLTDNFKDNQYFLTVRGPTFGPFSFPVMANRLSRRKDSDMGKVWRTGISVALDEVGLGDEDDPEIERSLPPVGRVLAHPDSSLAPGFGVLEITAKPPVDLGPQAGSLALSLQGQGGSPGDPIPARVLFSEPTRLGLELPPELTDRLSLALDVFDVGLVPAPLTGLRADSSSFVKRQPPPPPEPEPEPAQPPQAFVADDPSQGPGWAVLTVNAASEAGLLNPGAFEYTLRVRDPLDLRSLAFRGGGFDWVEGDSFVNAPFVSLADGVLTLQVIPGLTKRMGANPLGFTVAWEGGALSEIPVDTSLLTGPQVDLAPPPPPVPAYVPPPEPKKGGKGLLIGIIALVLLLAAGGLAYWKFFRGGGEPDRADLEGQARPEAPPGAPEEAQPEPPAGAQPEPPAGAPPETPAATPPGPPPGQGGPAAGPPQAAPGPRALGPVEEAEALITRGSSQAQLVRAYERFRAQDDPESVDASYRLARTLSKYDAGYRAVVGEYYDPLSDAPVPGYISKNALTAYQHYDEAYKAGHAGAKDRMDSLLEWARGPGAGQPGADELLGAARGGSRG